MLELWAGGSRLLRSKSRDLVSLLFNPNKPELELSCDNSVSLSIPIAFCLCAVFQLLHKTHCFQLRALMNLVEMSNIKLKRGCESGLIGYHGSPCSWL